MQTNTRYIVIYRDNPKDQPRYFGPFASKQRAELFEQRLPPEGNTFIRQFEPYAPHEIDDIVKMIVDDRKPETGRKH